MQAVKEGAGGGGSGRGSAANPFPSRSTCRKMGASPLGGDARGRGAVPSVWLCIILLRMFPVACVDKPPSGPGSPWIPCPEFPCSQCPLKGAACGGSRAAVFWEALPPGNWPLSPSPPGFFSSQPLLGSPTSLGLRLADSGRWLDGPCLSQGDLRVGWVTPLPKGLCAEQACEAGLWVTSHRSPTPASLSEKWSHRLTEPESPGC